MAEIGFYEVTLGGDRLMMRNERFVDPLDAHTKALREFTKKKNKTDADHLELARREFLGSLYCDEKLGPYIPDKWLNEMLVEGARKRKLGRTFEASVIVVDEKHPLQYRGPRTAAALWAAGTEFVDRRCVGNQQNRVMRTRPIFRDWRVTFSLQVLDGGPNGDDIELAIEDAGPYGIGDGRPKYAGKFALLEFKNASARKAA